MREVEAKSDLASLLDLVEQGEEVTITRDGKPVARLVAAEDVETRRARARRAAAEMDELTKNWRLDGLSIKALIEEGRR